MLCQRPFACEWVTESSCVPVSEYARQELNLQPLAPEAMSISGDESHKPFANNN